MADSNDTLFRDLSEAEFAFELELHERDPSCRKHYPATQLRKQRKYNRVMKKRQVDLSKEQSRTMQEESDFQIVWPLKFLELLLDLNYKIVENENILLGIYENYLWYSADFDPMIVNNTTHYIYDEQYIELKNVTIKFYINNENFGSKILPNKDVIVYEKLLDTASPLCFRKQLIYKIIHTAPNKLSLKDQCRKQLRQILRKRDIHHSIHSLQIPTVLKKYLMYIENGPEVGNKDFQLTFTTPYLLKLESKLVTNDGPILRITENYDIDNLKTVFQQAISTPFM